MDDTDQKNKFLESLVIQYDSLVQDMTKSINECHNLLKSQSEEQVNKAYQDNVGLLSLELSQKNAVIENLQKQLEMSRKSQFITKNLWQFTLQHIEETLETRKVPNNQHITKPVELSKRGIQSLPSDFLTKWKLLHAYAKNLENLLDKSAKDKYFYRNKIMEIRLHYEATLKTQAIHNMKEIEQVKASFNKEIEYLRSSIDKIRQNNRSSLEKHLNAEKEAWEYQEAKKLQLVRLQVEQVLLANETLLSHERECATKSTKDQHTEFLDIKYPEPLLVAREISKVVSKRNQKNQIIQTDFEFIYPDQLERLKTSQYRLEMEYDDVINKLDTSKQESIDKTTRLESRIRELERLNAALHSQISDLTNKNNRISKASSDDHSSSNKKFQNFSDEFEINQCVALNPSKPLPLQSILLKNHDSVSIDEQRREMRITILKQEIQRLKHERMKLLDAVEKQQSLITKWKTEFIELAKRTLPI